MQGLPHAGGDIPRLHKSRHCHPSAAPRRWGYTGVRGGGAQCVRGCPTQVGINPLKAVRNATGSGLPHAGGDIPSTYVAGTDDDQAAPRRWGYTHHIYQGPGPIVGCPTQVGIYLDWLEPRIELDGLPHAGGDIPRRLAWLPGGLWAAPRRWGYTHLLNERVTGVCGCPTQVGIYLYARNE